VIFENRPSAGNGGTTDGQALTAALVVVQSNLETALEVEGLGANHAKLLRVDVPGLWEKPRNCSDGAITAFADAGDDEHVVVTSNGHPLQNGDLVVIAGTTDYDGEYEVSSVAVNTFEIVATWGVTREGTWRFVVEYYSPEEHYKALTGLYASRYYFGAVENADVIGQPADELLGVYFRLVDSTATPVILTSPCTGRYVKSADEIVSIDEIDGDVTVNITVTTSTLAISNGWIDVLKSGA
jgi:hypothetical protein